MNVLRLPRWLRTILAVPIGIVVTFATFIFSRVIVVLIFSLFRPSAEALQWILAILVSLGPLRAGISTVALLANERPLRHVVGFCVFVVLWQVFSITCGFYLGSPPHPSVYAQFAITTIWIAFAVQLTASKTSDAASLPDNPGRVVHSFNDWFVANSDSYRGDYFPSTESPCSGEELRAALRSYFPDLDHPIDFSSFSACWNLYVNSSFLVEEDTFRRIKRFDSGRCVRFGRTCEQNPLSGPDGLINAGRYMWTFSDSDFLTSRIEQVRQYYLNSPGVEYPDDLHGDRKFLRELGITRITEAASLSMEWWLFITSKGCAEYLEDSEYHRRKSTVGER